MKIRAKISPISIDKNWNRSSSYPSLQTFPFPFPFPHFINIRNFLSLPVCLSASKEITLYSYAAVQDVYRTLPYHDPHRSVPRLFKSRERTRRRSHGRPGLQRHPDSRRRVPLTSWANLDQAPSLLKSDCEPADDLVHVPIRERPHLRT